MRRAWSRVVDGHNTWYRPNHSRNERYGNRASLPRRERNSGAVIGLGVASAGGDGVYREVDGTVVRRRNGLGRAGRVQDLVAKGEVARTN